MPKLLGDELADKLWEKVARVDAAGNVRTVSAYELIIERFVESIPSAKPKEIMAMLVWMQHLDVFDSMRAKVTDPHVNLYEDRHDEWWHGQMVTKGLREQIRREADARAMASPCLMALREQRERSG